MTHNKKYFGKNSNKFNQTRIDYKDFEINEKNGCPFHKSPKGAKIHCGMKLLEKEGYVSFAIGYRRCPGEHITMELLDEFSNIIKTLEYKIILKNNKFKKEKYIWEEIDKNIIIIINSII